MLTPLGQVCPAKTVTGSNSFTPHSRRIDRYPKVPLHTHKKTDFESFFFCDIRLYLAQTVADNVSLQADSSPSAEILRVYNWRMVLA